MSKFWSAAILLGILSATPVSAWDRGEVDVLAVLPDVTPGVPSSVEGLTVGPDGNIYVTSFGFNAKGPITSGNSVLFVIKPNGNLVRKVPIANSSPHTLGLAFNPVNGFLLVLDFGAGKVLHVDPMTGASSVFFSIPSAQGPGLNALTFDKLGNVYMSDSFNGVIWKTGPNGGTAAVCPQSGTMTHCSGNGVNWPTRVSRRPSAQMALSSTMPAQFCLSQTPQPIRSSRFR